MARAPASTVDLVIPVKPLWAAKSRLRGAVGDAAHARLALALALDTIAAARAARRVRGLLVMSTDPEVAAGLAAEGVAVAPDGPAPGLNPALEHGAGLLRARDAEAAVGALQADLPALTPAELDDALAQALAAFRTGTARAFCADAAGTGTTLLLAAPRAGLDPRFGRGSAGRHRDSGAVELRGRWPGLRHDVDTGPDLARAAVLGLGPCTRDVLALARRS